MLYSKQVTVVKINPLGWFKICDASPCQGLFYNNDQLTVHHPLHNVLKHHVSKWTMNLNPSLVICSQKLSTNLIQKSSFFFLFYFVQPSVSKGRIQSGYYVSMLMEDSQHNSPQYVLELIDRKLFLDVYNPGEGMFIQHLFWGIISNFKIWTIWLWTSMKKSINPSTSLKQSLCICSWNYNKRRM